MFFLRTYLSRVFACSLRGHGLLLAFLLWWNQSPAQEFRSFEVQNGAAQPRIECLLQHPQGYLLAGTTTGLFAFHGVSFTRLLVDSAIGSHHITSMGIVQGSEVWIGFQNGMLGRLAGKKVVPLQFEEGSFKVAVTDIVADSMGRIWCATAGEGAYCYDKKRWFNCNTDDGMSDNYVYDLLALKSGMMLAATDAGVNAIQFAGNRKQISYVAKKDGLRDDITTTLARMPDGTILAGHHENGLSALRVGNNRLQAIQSDDVWEFGRVNAIQVIGNGVYVSTSDSGMIHVQQVGARQSYKRLTGTRDFNQHSLADAHGNLWLSAGNQLAIAFHPQVQVLLPLNAQLVNAIHAVMADKDGNTWYARQNVLYKLRPGKSKALKAVILPTPEWQTEVTSLYQDASGIIWVGTMNNGIWQVHPTLGVARAFAPIDILKKASILKVNGRANDIWVSSLGGAVKCVMQTAGSPTTFPTYTCELPPGINSIGTNYIYDILIDSRGRTWYATDGRGITLLDKGQYLHYTEKNGLASEVVYSLAEDASGRIWINVLNGGLHYFGTDNRWHHFTDAQGLSTNVVSSILADAEGNIIAISATGIDVISSKTLAVQSINANYGLARPGTDLHIGAAMPGGGVVLATAKGIQQVKTNFRFEPVRAYIESVELFLAALDAAHSGKFSSSENNLGIHFNAAALVQPEKLRFQYRLDGLGNTWVTTNDRYINFPKLPPGKYTFRVRASLSNQFSLSPVATYSFTIARPYWQQWWFVMLAAAFVAFLVVTIIRYRDRQREHVQELRQAHLQSQLETLRSQVSPHFFFNSLNTLMMLIEEDKPKALQYTSHLSDFFRKIVQLRDEETILLEDELMLVKDYLFIQQQRFGNGIQLHNKLNGDTLRQMKIAPLTLQLLIENAIKHNAFTELQPLHITLYEQKGHLLVSNNRRDKIGAEPGAGMGLQNIQKRYKLLTSDEVEVQADTEYFRVIIPLLD